LRPEGGAIGRGEWLRKAVHIGSGGCALLLHWLPPWGAWLLAAGALAGNLFLLPAATGHALERDAERRGGRAWGIIFYPLSVLILTLVFHDRLEIAAAAWGLMAFGDGLATLFGKLWPVPRLAWNRSKSLAGSLAFVVFGLAAAWPLYLFVAAGHGRDLEPLHAFLLILATTLLAALLESLATGIDDNLLVPLSAGPALFALTLVDPALVAAQQPQWAVNLLWGLAVNLLVGGLAWRARAVDASGFAAGMVLGTGIFTFGGGAGYLMLLAFFVLGSGATRVGYAVKQAAGIAQARGGARGVRNAVANCGAGAVLIMLAAATPHGALLLVGFVAAFATAAFDTVSSEIGQVYGRRTFLITTLRPVPRGTEGAISLEGTLAGVAASLLLGGLGVATGLIPVAALGPVLAGAFAGAMGESVLGASLEARQVVDNEVVNFLNTVAGAAVAVALARFIL
jgi:uncharacterized protein (TIGR00297 family)